MKYKYLLLLFLFGFWACSTSKSSNQNWEKPEGALDKMDLKANQDERMVVYQAQINLVVEDIDSLRTQMQDLAKSHGGYLQRFSDSYTVMRVEASQFESAIDAIGGLGKVKGKNISGEDVTDEFFDYRIRLENAEKTRERYLQLLKKATTVEDIIKVERELSRLNEKIDLIKGKINRIDNLHQLATISISTRQRERPGILGYVGIGIYKVIEWLFIWK